MPRPDRSRWMTVALALTLAATCGAQAPAAPTDVGGAIRIWGHGHKGEDYILTLLKAWQEGYRATHPEARFVNELDGNASAIGGLFTGAADLAILDREASFIEVDAYQQGAGHNPFRIPVARGSVDIPHHAPALIVYVNRLNPLDHLNLQQLDGIFDADHRLAERSYTKWGDLGLDGTWAERPIHRYTNAIQSAETQFLERAAMKGSQKFSCCLTLFAAQPGLSSERQIADAAAKDPYALAVSTLPAPGLKALAISSTSGKPAVFASPQTITGDAYPLARTVYVYANRAPKAPLEPRAAAFLEYIVGPEGQAIVARTGGYLPLSPELEAKAREALQ